MRTSTKLGIAAFVMILATVYVLPGLVKVGGALVAGFLILLALAAHANRD